MQQLDARPAMLADRDLPPLLAPLARSSRRLGWRRDAMVNGPWCCSVSLSRLFRTSAFRQGGTRRFSAVTPIGDPGEDPALSAKASGRCVARESPAPAAMRKHRRAAVYWHFPRMRTMAPTRLFSRRWVIPPVRVFRQPCAYPSGTHPDS